MAESESSDLTTLTVQLLSAYVANNAVPSSDLAELIRTTRAALAEEKAVSATTEPEYVPAVSVRASTASRDHLISLIDGKPYKSLKRHLTNHGLTPDEYRVRFNLPKTYPMVAPNYSEQRRQVAKQLGLGRKKSDTASTAAPEQPGQAAGGSTKKTKAKPATPKAAGRRRQPKTPADAPSDAGAVS